jgi:hypothetical protein
MGRRLRLLCAKRGANQTDQDESSKEASDRQQDVAGPVPGAPAHR